MSQSLLPPQAPLGFYCEPDEYGRCLTCSDEALPATVLQIDELGYTAVVHLDNQPAEVDICLVDDVTIGTVLLVHAGVALAKVENSQESAI